MGKDTDNKNARAKKKKLDYKIIIAALAVGICVFLLSKYDVLSNIDYDISDVMFQPGGNLSLPIVVIGIDEETVQEYGQYQFWERDIYARALDRIHSLCEPSVVAFDILFTGTKDPEKDQMLVDACKKYGDVVTGA